MRIDDETPYKTSRLQFWVIRHEPKRNLLIYKEYLQTYNSPIREMSLSQYYRHYGLRQFASDSIVKVTSQLESMICSPILRPIIMRKLSVRFSITNRGRRVIVVRTLVRSPTGRLLIDMTTTHLRAG